MIQLIIEAAPELLKVPNNVCSKVARLERDSEYFPNPFIRVTSFCNHPLVFNEAVDFSRNRLHKFNVVFAVNFYVEHPVAICGQCRSD